MSKMDKQRSVSDFQRDDALFEALGKNKKRKTRRLIITVVSIVVALAMIAIAGVSFLQRRVREQFSSNQGDVLSYEVSTGSISTVVSGSGSLTDVDLEEITVPDGVQISEVLVKRSQTITSGDILATVDMASVVSAMADLQAQIEELDAKLSDAEDDSADTVIKAGVTGRVKAILGEKDADVADVMYEHGALALISLDGYMAVDIETDALSVGDSVTVKLHDEKMITGTVESVVGEKATILVTDNGPKYAEAVSILNEEGADLGSGDLYIHSPLRVTGFSGIISYANVSENAKVSSSSVLFHLKDTAYSANYNSLLRERAALEETLLELMTIQHNGAVLAKMDGSVYSVDYSDEAATAVVTLSADEKMSVTISVDESDILSLELGQTVTVSVPSVSEDTFPGTLTEINRTSSSSGTYSAVIEVEKVAGMLSGMTASVSVRIEGVDDAILIPVEALHKTGDGAYVYTTYNEEYQEYGGKVDVVTGLENSTYVQIKSGLHVGDTVYYTEPETGFGNFGGMGFGNRGSGGFGNSGDGNGGLPDMGGNMPDMGNRPGFGSGEMPDMGSGSQPGRNFGSDWG